jgi:hypothetical protein
MKTFKLKPIKNAYRQIMLVDEGEDKTHNLTMAEMLINMVRLIESSGKMTSLDANRGRRLIGQCLDATKTTLSIEEAEHDWAKEQVVSEWVTNNLGTNADVIKELLDDFERIKEPASDN